MSPQPSRTQTSDAAALALMLAQTRAQIRGLDVEGLDTAQIQAILDEQDAAADAHPVWLLGPRDAQGGTVEETVAFMVAVAQAQDGDTPLGEALYDVLVNASGHTPAFSERADGTLMRDPYGCTVCGCADGTSACDTWTSGLDLARALTAQNNVSQNYASQSAPNGDTP